MLISGYTFDIRYKKNGVGSADMLSRPVLNFVVDTLELNSIVSLFENQSAFNPIQDIMEDASMQYRVKHGRHVSGLSTKRVKKLEKQIQIRF